MSLRTKILLYTIPAVVLLVALLSLLLLSNLVATNLQSSRTLAEFAAQQTKQALLQRLEEASKQGASSREAWTEAIANDARFAQSLVSSLAQAPSLVEISVATENDRILVSSTQSIQGTNLRQRPSLYQLLAYSPIDRIRRVREQGQDYELRIPIGLLNDPKPIFKIQVLVSMALVNNLISGGLRWIGFASLGALLASLILVSLLAGLVSRELRRLEESIDLIRRGESVSTSRPSGSTPEFAAVQSKLKLLGAEVRDTAQTAADFRSRVSEVLENLEEGLLLFDSETRLILSGGATQRMLGTSQPDVRNTPIAPLLRQAFETRQSLPERIISWPIAGGSPVPLLVAIDFSSDSRCLVRLRDPEGRRRLESQMELLSRLDSINRLTGGVAHEIKNPLNSIAAHLALLETMTDSEEGAEEIRVITEEVERLDRVVRTFLDFTRPVELDRKEFDIAELAAEVASFIRPDAERRAIRLRVESDPSKIPLWGDPDILRQALLNLAVNAIDAMPEGGELTLKSTGQDSGVEVTVTDTGTGIPPGKREKIFQLYFTTKPNGSGIGLAMVYRAVQLHGGSIEVESEPGKGSRFILKFPVLAAS